MKLLFIVSQPRSGSTLLQSLLSNNDYVNTVSEPWILLPFLSFNEPGIQNGVYNSKLAKVGIEEFLETLNLKNFIKKSLQELLLSLYSSLKTEKTKYILDKTPRYYEILNLIPVYFPDSKIIILKRNPLDVVKSIVKTWNVKNFPQLSFYSRDILNAPYLIEDFVSKNKSNPNVLEVFYETLTSEPESEVKRIYEWLELPFNVNVLEYKKNKKLEGSMGDKVGINKYEGIVSNKSEKVERYGGSKFWEQFYFGYQYFLGEKFLNAYGNYKSTEKLKPTKTFQDFVFLNKINYFKGNRLSVKDLLYLIKLKFKSRFLAEYNY